MPNESMPKRTFAFRFYRAIGMLGFIPFVIFTLDALLTPTIPHPLYNNIPVRLAQALVFAPLTVGLGLFCARRQPDNVIGWMLVGLGYGLCADSMRSDFGGSVFRAMFGSIGIGYFWFTNLLLPCHFPDGQLYPPRIRTWGNRFVGFVLLLPLTVIVTAPEFRLLLNNELADGRIIASNPFHVPALRGLDFNVIGAPLILFLGFYGISTLIVRSFQQNRRIRLQIRWLLAGYVVAILSSFIPIPIVGIGTVIIFGFLFPSTIAYAILRHRLYDIDIIIRRTLVYSVLTGILAAIYFGGIILTQQLFRAATGETSDLAIVVSTLLIAALFSPVRRRVQEGIDRRLYRRKYDAEKTLADFQKNLRDEVDVETLKANLVGVVSDTMQPARMALWVREIKGE